MRHREARCTWHRASRVRSGGTLRTGAAGGGCGDLAAERVLLLAEGALLLPERALPERRVAAARGGARRRGLVLGAAQRDVDRLLRAAALDAQRHLVARGVGADPGHEVREVLDPRVADLGDDVARLQPCRRGRRAVLDRGERGPAGGLLLLAALLAALDPEHRLGRAAGVEYLLSDATGLVDRNREAQADAAAALPGSRDRRVDADDLSVEVHQRAAGVALVDRGVGLQAVVDDRRAVFALHTDRAVERADDARGDRAGQALRRADRHHLLADLEVRALAECRGRQPGDVLHAQHGEVVAGGGAHDRRGVLGAVGEGDGDGAARTG